MAQFLQCTTQTSTDAAALFLLDSQEDAIMTELRNTQSADPNSSHDSTSTSSTTALPIVHQ